MEEPIEFILKDFPGTRYYPKFHLTTWHPMGILDQAVAEKVIEFIEWEKRALFSLCSRGGRLQNLGRHLEPFGGCFAIAKCAHLDHDRVFH